MLNISGSYNIKFVVRESEIQRGTVRVSDGEFRGRDEISRITFEGSYTLGPSGADLTLSGMLTVPASTRLVAGITSVPHDVSVPLQTTLSVNVLHSEEFVLDIPLSAALPETGPRTLGGPRLKLSPA